MSHPGQVGLAGIERGRLVGPERAAARISCDETDPGTRWMPWRNSSASRWRSSHHPTAQPFLSGVVPSRFTNRPLLVGGRAPGWWISIGMLYAQPGARTRLIAVGLRMPRSVIHVRAASGARSAGPSARVGPTCDAGGMGQQPQVVLLQSLHGRDQGFLGRIGITLPVRPGRCRPEAPGHRPTSSGWRRKDRDEPAHFFQVPRSLPDRSTVARRPARRGRAGAGPRCACAGCGRRPSGAARANDHGSDAYAAEPWPRYSSV